MEIVGVIENGRVVLPPTVRLQEGARVRVIVDDESAPMTPYDRSPVSEDSVLADIAWATGKRFPP